jgi:feruloyl esterase
MVTRAVLASCGGKDGGAPGDAFLTDPRQCRFDPVSLPACRPGAAADTCVTATQLATLHRLYAGPTNPRTGGRIYAGLTIGSEDQPLGPVVQGDPTTWPDQQFYPFRWTLGTALEPSRFDFDRDLDLVDAELAGTLNANSADLSDFARHGGKLILYSGMADPAVPFVEVVDYYDRVGANDRALAEQSTRLFLIPGMGHCFGGPGVTDIGQPFTSDVPAAQAGDALMTLVAWAEGRTAPSTLIARAPGGNGQPDRERLVCAYPAFPEYRGGASAKRTSFACATHPHGTDQPAARRNLNQAAK